MHLVTLSSCCTKTTKERSGAILWRDIATRLRNGAPSRNRNFSRAKPPWTTASLDNAQQYASVRERSSFALGGCRHFLSGTGSTMVTCFNPKCTALLPSNGAKFRTCSKCCQVSCLICNAVHEGMNCRTYKASQCPAQPMPQPSPVKKDEASLVTAASGSERTAATKWPVATPSVKDAPQDASSGSNNEMPGDDMELDGGREVLVYCRAKGCSSAGVVGVDDPLFRCPTCGHFTCIACKAVHESLTCEEYKEKKGAMTEENSEEAATSRSTPSPTPPLEDDKDDDTAGIIVNCRFQGCEGYGFVKKSDTLSQCYSCNHWTCRRCNASHESKSCAEYQGKAPQAEDDRKDDLQCFCQTCRIWFQAPVPHYDDCPSCGGNRYLCSNCTSPACQRCPREEKSGGFFAGAVRMIKGILPNASSTVPSPKPQVQAPKRKDAALESGNRKEHSTRADLGPCYETCKNHVCSKYGVRHLGPCSQRDDDNCDKAYKRLENGPACESCGRGSIAVKIEDCEHNVCKACIESALKEAYSAAVSCPVKQTSGRCSGILSKGEMKRNVSRSTYKKYKAMLTWEKTKCLNEKCQVEFCKEPGKEQLKCPKCKTVNCFACKACHKGLSCTQYIEELVYAMDKGLLEDPKQKEARAKEHLSLYEQDYVRNTEEFDCPLCFAAVPADAGLVLKNCHHKLCKECLVNTAKNSDTALVRCPCLEGDDPCTMDILDTDIRAVMDAEDYNVLLERGFCEAERQTPGAFHCKTVNCKAWCTYDVEVNTFECPICGMPNCLRCEAIHQGMNCEQYQEDLKRRAANDAAARASINFLENLLENGEAMRCPTCKVIVIKRSGCDYMLCASCRTALCWATKGARWGPRGQGDTSGGCRCGVNGVKCHPTCTTCH